jgi:hypothetical protein
MTGLSNAHHFRKMVAGFCMIFAPLVLLIGLVIHPEAGTSASSTIAAAAEHPDAWYIAHLFALVALVLAVPAVLGLMHMLREREVAWGHLGGGFAMLGILAFIGVVTMEGFVGWQAGVGDSSEMVALFDRLYDTAGVVVPFYVMSFAFALGMLCLAYGLYRARAVQSWMVLFLGLSAVLMAIGFPTASELVSIIGAAFLFVGLGSIGRMVLRESDEAWEHTPEYEGFRPLAGMR